MAGEELLALLSPSDLQNFQQSVYQGSPSYMGAQAIGSWQPNMQTWSPAAQGLGSFGKAFLSGVLGNFARQEAAQQMNSVVGLLPQLRSDPQNVALPEGMDKSAFEMLKGTAILKKAQRDATVAEDPSFQLKKLTLLEKIIDNPRNAQALDSKVPGLLKNLLGKDYPEGGFSSASTDAVGKPVIPQLSPLDSALLNGKPSVADKEKAYAKEFVESGGYTPAQAAISAREKLKGESAANNKSFDEGKDARTFGQNLLQLANTARAGMANAGQTGSTLASWYEKALSTLAPWSTPEADKQAAGDAVLNSVAPDVIKLARPIGGGATSDFEARTYLGSGPSTSNTPEANAILVQKLENLGKMNLEYADFLDYYREVNGGSVNGAAALWSKYKQAFPLFKDGEINSSRPSWQDYFSGGATSGSTGSQYEIRTAPDGRRYKVLLGR